MSRLNDQYTSLQQQLIHRLAEIEESDRNVCAGCGGEDCACCEIYLDRQKWLSPDALFAEAEQLEGYHDEDDESEESEDDAPPRPAPHTHETPCDYGECPYIDDRYGTATSMYFCRDHCGVGIDD